MDHTYWRNHSLQRDLLKDYVLEVLLKAQTEGDRGGGNFEALGRIIMEVNTVNYNDGIYALKLQAGYNIVTGETISVDWDTLINQGIPRIPITEELLIKVRNLICSSLNYAEVEVKDDYNPENAYISICIEKVEFTLWIGKQNVGDNSELFEGKTGINLRVGEYSKTKAGTMKSMARKILNDLLMARSVYPIILEALFCALQCEN